MSNIQLMYHIGASLLLCYALYKDYLAKKKERYMSQNLWFLSSILAVLIVGFGLNWLLPYDYVMQAEYGFNFFFTNSILWFFTFFVIMLLYLIKTHYSLNYEIPFEAVALISVSVHSVLLLISHGDSFINIYVCIELLSICSILLSFNLKGGLKGSLIYYVLSAIGSGCLLFGISFMYFIVGGETFADLAVFFHHSLSTLAPWKLNILKFGYILFVCGIFIKLGTVVPFHLWIGEVYNTANTYVVTYFASIPMLGLFGILLHINMAIGYTFIHSLDFFFYGLSIFSVFIGTFGAMHQTKLKRVFAFSSISNVGFIICLFPNVTWESYSTIVFFIFLYSFNAFCLWASLTVFEYGLKVNVNNFKDLSKLYHSGRIGKMNSVYLLVFLFSSIGIPPLSGFFGKYFLFLNLVTQDQYGLLFYFIFMSCLSAFYFLRVVITIVLPNNNEEYFFCRWVHDNLATCLIFAALFHIAFFFVMSLLAVKCHVTALSLYLFYAQF